MRSDPGAFKAATKKQMRKSHNIHLHVKSDKATCNSSASLTLLFADEIDGRMFYSEFSLSRVPSTRPARAIPHASVIWRNVGESEDAHET
jgi:hypothetical protein